MKLTLLCLAAGLSAFAQTAPHVEIVPVRGHIYLLAGAPFALTRRCNSRMAAST